MKCTFNMALLESDQCGLKAGYEIKARVKSRNQRGWSAWTQSDQCQNAVHVPTFMVKRPPALPKPSVHQEVTTSFKVCYQPCTGENCAGYQISWTPEGGARNVMDITDMSVSCRYISNLQPGTRYNICVRSTDQCSESCKTQIMTPPPSPPKCTIGVCDPVRVTCATSEVGVQLCTGYDVAVQVKNSQIWTIYDGCGRTGGNLMNCEIPHSFLVQEAGYAECDTVQVKVRARNAFGASPWSAVLQTPFVSKPSPIYPLTVSKNYQHISWKHCKACNCKYNVDRISPMPELSIAKQITDLHYKMPMSLAKASQQFRVVGFNQCGSTEVCTPIQPIPTFSEACPTQVSWKPLID